MVGSTCAQIAGPRRYSAVENARESNSVPLAPGALYVATA